MNSFFRIFAVVTILSATFLGALFLPFYSLAEEDDSFSFFRSGKSKGGKKKVVATPAPMFTPAFKTTPHRSFPRFKSEDVVPRRSTPFRKPDWKLKEGPIIVLDPGHGGKDLGARGVTGLYEKDIVLDISLMLRDLIKAHLSARVLLTREDDVELALSDRTQFANDSNADLFVSVHANASDNRSLNGIETYYLDNTDDKSSLKLAQRENATSQTFGSDLEFILSDLIQNAKLDDSISLAHFIQNSLTGMLSESYSDINSYGVKKAPFYVLVGAHMPCVLVEVSFADHPTEGRRLATKGYQRLIARAIFEGIADYLIDSWKKQQ